MKKNILFIYGSYGSGHKTISNYVKEYFVNNSNYNVLSIDLVDYCNLLGTVGLKLFNFSFYHRTSKIFATCYEILDHKIIKPGYKKLCIKSFDNEELRKTITDFKPDLTISTHFFGSTMLAYYNKLNLTNSKILTIITDYKSHQFWECDYKDQDGLIVGNDIVKNELVHKGIPEKMIYSYGIPLVFNENKILKSKTNLIKEYNLDEDKPIYLFFGGGSTGSLAYYEYFKKLAKCELPINIIFVCGNNQELKEKCDSLVKKYNFKNIKILGFVTDVYSLYNLCDCVISKSGGATVTECLETKKPLIIIPGMGGQEFYNARFMVKKGYSLKARNTNGFVKVMKKITKYPIILSRLKSKINEADKNDSVRKIFNLSVKLLKK